MDLSNVPFFQRPMQARNKDQFVGQDEAGNSVFRMGSGQTYTVKPNEDQRTTRTKVEEDVIPAVKEFASNPSLPSLDQMKQFGSDMVEGTYESVKGAVEGTGTMGDAFGVAPAMAVGSAAFEAPEGAIRLFGGARAESPGTTRSQQPAPESFGADGNYRFEIDDSQMAIVPQNIQEFDGTQVTQNTKLPTLADVTIHDELFYQYPEVERTKIFADTSLHPETWGYYDFKKDAIAVNPNLLKSGQGENLKKLILHEVQHKLQDIEGFTQGTNMRAREVLVMTAERIESPKNREDWRVYEQQVKEFENPDKFPPLLTLAEEFIEEYAKRKGLRLGEPGVGERLGKTLGISGERTPEEVKLKFTLDRIKNLQTSVKQGQIPAEYFNTYVGEVNYHYKNLASIVENDQDASKLFTGITDIDPQALTYEGPSASGAFDFFYLAPEIPELPAPGTSRVGNHVLHSTYERKQGEVEANNVMARSGFTLEERFRNPPESTEMYPRDEQWEKAPYYSKGGLVPVDEQMKGLNVDPVSGNEVPPGSLPEEVRDDVDARLSEGEYVVPADVVRYFGVGYFEKLREKAKKALDEMDKDGRIGGEPVDGDEDDLPFSEEELAFLEEQEGSPPPVGMAAGGMVGGFAQGFDQEMTNPSVKTQVYRNAEGEERTIMFVDGQPIQRIPAGFNKVEAGSADPKVENQEANREGGMSADGTDSGFGNEAGTATGGFADAMAGAMDGTLGGTLGGVGSAIGGAISGAFGGGGTSGGTSSGPSAGASDSGPNGGMGGYANRGMLVNRKVKQKPQSEPADKSLVKRKAKK
jgi:hypothetical protein